MSDDNDKYDKAFSTLPDPGDLWEIATVKCDTTVGEFEMTLNRKWSPHGFDRAVELFQKGFYDNSHFFRVVPDFLVQFGIR